MKLVLMMFILAFAAEAMAKGGQGGNGGGGLVCRNELGEIKSIQMFDLYEGRSRYQFTGEALSGKTSEEILEKAYARVRDYGDSLAAKIEAAEKLFQANIVFTDMPLDESPDANKVMIEKGCRYEQIVTWDDRVLKVFVNQELYNALDVVGRAALSLHEAVYWVARNYSKQSYSDDTREFVARVFFNEKIITNIDRGYEKSGVYKVKNELEEDDRYGMNTYRINWSSADCYDYSMRGISSNVLTEFSIIGSGNKKKDRRLGAIVYVPVNGRYARHPGDLTIDSDLRVEMRASESELLQYRVTTNSSVLPLKIKYGSTSCQDVLESKVILERTSFFNFIYLKF
jgi:hypothetical protein